MSQAPADNLFAKILAGDIPSHSVYENDHVYAFLDLFPQAPGHTLVIPRNYSPNVLVAESDDLHYCLQAVKLLMPAIMKVTGALGVTIVTNTGKEAGQMIEYLHFHILPRSPRDEIKLGTLGGQADNQELAETAQKIRAEIIKVND